MIIRKKRKKVNTKKKKRRRRTRTKIKTKLYIWLGFRLQRLFFPKWPYLTGPSKGYEKETSLRDSIWLKGLPNACLMPFWKEDDTRFKCYSNWLQPFDDEISLLCVWNSDFTVSRSTFSAEALVITNWFSHSWMTMEIVFIPLLLPLEQKLRRAEAPMM